MDQQNYFLEDLSDTQSNQESNEDFSDSSSWPDSIDYPDNWICGICRDIYLDPCQLIPCEHVFCETCLRRLNQAGMSNCPICRRQIQNTMPVEDLRNQIMETYRGRERAESEQQSNVYSLDLPPHTPGWMELIQAIFGMEFQISLDLSLVLRFGLRDLLLWLMVVLTEFLRVIVRIREENFHSIPTLMAVFFMKILAITVAFLVLPNL